MPLAFQALEPSPFDPNECESTEHSFCFADLDPERAESASCGAKKGGAKVLPPRFPLATKKKREQSKAKRAERVQSNSPALSGLAPAFCPTYRAAQALAAALLPRTTRAGAWVIAKVMVEVERGARRGREGRKEG